MAIVISSTVFTRQDMMGNPWVEGWFLVEFRDANYTLGGENLALNTYMSRIEHINAQFVSGNNNYETSPNLADYPANAGSGRLQLYYMGSGIVTLNISGLRVGIQSGALIVTSGVGPVQSGRIEVTGSGAFNAGLLKIEILSGVAVSGTRTKLHVLGY